MAHLLKQQGLIQELSAGIAEDVKIGPGFMFWRVQVELTEAGLGHVDHVIATVYRGVQVRRCALGLLIGSCICLSDLSSCSIS